MGVHLFQNFDFSENLFCVTQEGEAVDIGNFKILFWGICQNKSLL